MGEDGIQLDDAAKELFNEFQGIAARKKFKPGDVLPGSLAEGIEEEQLRQDGWRILLIQLIYSLGAYLRGDHRTGTSGNEVQAFKQIANLMVKLSRMTGHDGKVLVRYRGVPTTPDTPEKFDYEIIFGNLLVDMGLIPKIVKRHGPKMTPLSDQLLQGFSTLSSHAISNLFIKLPKELPADVKTFRTCLHILAQFKRAQEANTPIALIQDGKRVALPIVPNEKNRPDPNLTMVAGINHLAPKAIQGLIKKVDMWMLKKAATKSTSGFTCVYDAIYGMQKLSAKLLKPPLEVNNVTWLMISNYDQKVTQSQARVAQFVVDHAQGSPQKVARVIQSVYGDDYGKINVKHLGDRLHLSSDLLTSIDNKPKEKVLSNEVLDNIQERLDSVSDHVFDELSVSDSQEDGDDSGKDSVIGIIHKQLFKMVSFFQNRSTTRSKMKAMVQQPIQFSDQDYETLAQDFEISLKEAQELVATLRSCFGSQGNFNKTAFASHIPKYIEYEKKIFDFLWHHLKDVILQEDRVTFLNSLQLLTSQMKQPKRAFRILLEDFCDDPEVVHYSDDKALMLANLLVHRYAKELADIEITPEDILLNRKGIDKGLAKYASWRIDKDQDKFFEKVRTIHGRLAESLGDAEGSKTGVDKSTLLRLERELFILFAQVSGQTAKTVIRSGLKEYANPTALIYASPDSANYMSHMLQNLRVALRGLGCIGGPEDIPHLEEIKRREEEFIHLKKSKEHRTQAQLISEWVDDAIKYLRIQV